jgi:hypothetical protein
VISEFQGDFFKGDEKTFDKISTLLNFRTSQYILINFSPLINKKTSTGLLSISFNGAPIVNSSKLFDEFTRIVNFLTKGNVKVVAIPVIWFLGSFLFTFQASASPKHGVTPVVAQSIVIDRDLGRSMSASAELAIFYEEHVIPR